MATEPDPKEMLGALMNITQVQQRQTADLLEDMRQEIGKLQTATALAHGAADGIRTTAASTVQAVSQLETRVSQAAAAAVKPAMEASLKWAVVPAVRRSMSRPSPSWPNCPGRRKRPAARSIRPS